MEPNEDTKLVVIEGSRKRDLQGLGEYQDRPADNSPMAMLAMAVRQGADVDKIEKLMALQERHEANEARKAFVAALAEFKAEPLTINKDKHVSFTTQKGTTAYDHATLGNICNIIGAALARHGLSYRWATSQEGKIKVTCTLMHNMGHQESVSLEAGADESGGKNSIQAVGSTVSYLQRYTLLAICGCATSDQDDDGRGSGDAGGSMPLEVLNAHLEKIDTAASKKELQSAYLPALCEASELRDQKAQDMLNEAKNSRLAKL
jgi:hypothetical protein